MKNILLITTSILWLNSILAQCSGTCANDQLSDLNSTTAINSSLLTGTTGLDLGSSSAEWDNIFLDPADNIMINYDGNRFLHINGGIPPIIGINPEGLFLGEYAGNGASGSNSGCVGIGFSALKAMTTGNHNTAIGWRSLKNLQGGGGGAGDKNTMVGSRAGQGISIGNSNTGFGHNVFYTPGETEEDALISGEGNTGIGAASTIDGDAYGVFGFLEEGSFNTVVGFGSGIRISTGNNNLIMGDNSGTAISDGNNNNIIGSTTATAITNGTDNIKNGNVSVSSLTTGSDNIYIGNGLNALSASATEDMNIGNAIYGDLSNGYVSIGSSTIPELFNVGSSTKFQVNTTGKVVASNGETADVTGNGVPINIKVIDLAAQSTSLGPTDLISSGSVTGGLYRISSEGVITTSASGGPSPASSLSIQIVYTDAAAGAMSVPKNLIEDITKTTSNVASSSSFTGSFIIKASASTAIRYKVNYASTGTTYMVYAIRVIAEKL